MSESNLVPHPGPRIERGRELLIAGMKGWFTDKTKVDIPAHWDRFIPYFGHVPDQQGRVAYGLISDVTEDGDGFHYMAGVEVSSIDSLPKELTHTHLAPRTYAVFPHPGTLEDLSQTMSFAFSDWLPKSGRKLDLSAEGKMDFFERYDEDFGSGDPGHIEIWIPLKP